MKLGVSVPCGVFLLACAVSAFAQSLSTSGTIRGTITDPSGASIPGASIEIHNPVSQYTQTTKSDAQGAFLFTNVPFNNYHLSATAAGFQGAAVDVDVRSAVPVDVKVPMLLGAAQTTVTVEAAPDLLQTEPTDHSNVDRNVINTLPLASNSSALSSVVTLTAPGVAADSNGMIHGLGDHAENTFSVDGQPITDQQSKAFSNQLPADAIQSINVIEGAPPAQYGDKTSLVIEVNTRSGLGVYQPHGEIETSYGTFGTSGGTADLSWGNNIFGNYISLNGLNTGRFLDTPEFQVFHDHGNEESIFDRVDYKPELVDSFAVNVFVTRSWFQNPNSYDAQDATAWNGLVADNGGLGPNGLPVGSQDQRSKIRSFDIAPTWTRLLGPHAVFTFGGYARQDQYNYYPSDNPFADFTPDLQTTSIGQNRRLTNLGLRSDISYVNGVHNLKAGATYNNTILTERDSFGIVDPDLNAVCLNADGTPNTNPNIMSTSQCTGSLTVNPAFVPLLGCFDLTRTGTLPASYGCSTSTSALTAFYGHADIRELSLYIQDDITIKNWTFNVGIRGDIYNGLTRATQAEPRLGIAYSFKPTNTVLRISYARTLETPFNENLLLSSSGCDYPNVAAIISATQGYPCLTAPMNPGYRNEFHAGLSQAFGKYFVLNGEYIWKYTHNAYDFSVFANTPITYPIEWSHSKIPGFALRGTLPNFHGLTAYTSMSHVEARFFGPQVAGVGVTPTSLGAVGVFRIDHDEAFNQTTHMQYQPFKRGPWLGFTWRYDSGLVAGAVPCAGGDCANGPAGTDSIVDVSNLTPDQQFEAGLYCGSVHATPTLPISPTGFCPASEYGSTLLRIPAPGTENDDHNPPRVAPRNVFDLALGDDNLFNGDRYKWSARVEVVNLANDYALYNFLSTFSGTHYLTPRTITGTVGFHF